MYTKQHARMIAALACAILLGWLGWRVAPVAAANTGDSLGTKFVNIFPQSRLSAVSINKVMVGDQVIRPGLADAFDHETKRGTPFQADQNWIKNMSISLLNRTDKVIVRAEFQLFFPETGDGKTQAVTAPFVTLGQFPEINTYQTHGRKLKPHPEIKPLVFAPGQTLVVSFADYADFIKRAIEGAETSMPFAQITKVNIIEQNFYFVDGMRWGPGGYQTPDPGHSGIYTVLNPRFFPGDSTRNWPPTDAPNADDQEVLNRPELVKEP